MSFAQSRAAALRLRLMPIIGALAIGLLFGGPAAAQSKAKVSKGLAKTIAAGATTETNVI